MGGNHDDDDKIHEHIDMKD